MASFPALLLFFMKVVDPQNIEVSHKFIYLAGCHIETFWKEKLSFMSKDVGVSLVIAEDEVLMAIS